MDIQAEKAKRRDALKKRKQEKELRDAGLSKKQAKVALSRFKAFRDEENLIGRDDRITGLDVDNLLNKLKILNDK